MRSKWPILCLCAEKTAQFPSTAPGLDVATVSIPSRSSAVRDDPIAESAS